MENTADWIQIRLNITAQQAPIIEQKLLDNGACAVTLEDASDQPIYEPEIGTQPLWNTTCMVGLFSADTDMKQVIETLKNQYSNNDFPQYSLQYLNDRVWEREWLKYFKPVQFNQLWICPSTLPIPDPNAINLILDPGLAFGTGAHPTTFLCIQWLTQQSLFGKEIMDYGCGSGILGIAALLLGAKHMTGIDIDPQALIASADNAKRNQIDPSNITLCTPENAPAVPLDYLVANILAEPLIGLAPTLCSRIASGGSIALSGILTEQADQVIQQYQKHFNLQPIIEKDGWVLITGKKHSTP